MSVSYALNLTESTLVLKAGYVRIPRGGFLKVAASDKEHADFVHAENRGWLSFSDTEPKSSPVAPVQAIEFHEPNRGLTAEELLAEKEKDKDRPPKATAKMEKLGDSKQVTSEPSVTKIGEEPKGEDAPKGARVKKIGTE